MQFKQIILLSLMTPTFVFGKDICRDLFVQTAKRTIKVTGENIVASGWLHDGNIYREVDGKTIYLLVRLSDKEQIDEESPSMGEISILMGDLGHQNFDPNNYAIVRPYFMADALIESSRLLNFPKGPVLFVTDTEGKLYSHLIQGGRTERFEIPERRVGRQRLKPIEAEIFEVLDWSPRAVGATLLITYQEGTIDQNKGSANRGENIHRLATIKWSADRGFYGFRRWGDKDVNSIDPSSLTSDHERSRLSQYWRPLLQENGDWVGGIRLNSRFMAVLLGGKETSSWPPQDLNPNLVIVDTRTGTLVPFQNARGEVSTQLKPELPLFSKPVSSRSLVLPDMKTIHQKDGVTRFLTGESSWGSNDGMSVKIEPVVPHSEGDPFFKVTARRKQRGR